MPDLQTISWIYVDSAVTTVFTAAAGTGYVVDTAAAAVTCNLPTGVAIGTVVVVKNAPAGGPQQGGAVPGNPVTVAAGAGETIEGAPTFTRNPPTGLTTTATSRFWPVGSASGTSGFGAGWAVE